MRRRRISILSPDFSGNALGRAYVLAKLLQDDFTVHIVAFGERDEIWPPIRNDATIEYRRFYYRSMPEFWLNASGTVRRLIDGDVILAVKPVQQSYGLGLFARQLLGKPLLLDIDDWEIGFLSESLYWEFRLNLFNWFLSPRSPLYTRCLDHCTHAADAVTVSNGFLQDLYGGTWIPHARNENAFNGYRADGKTLDLGVVRKTVLFLGTARLHKGLDDLLKAWAMVVDGEARLRIVGSNSDSSVVHALRPLGDARTSFEEAIPFERVPSVLNSAGVIVIPQKHAAGSVGQLPAKLIDAMAAGRPIVSTAVGDIPKWLANGAGLVVPPNDPPALARAIQSLLDQPEKANNLGRQALVRFQRFGSFAVVQPRLVKLVSDLIARRPVAPPEPVFSEN
jgi:glycosyltransferase involved in cell wall biosynthesis